MHSLITGLGWELWGRNRRLVWLMAVLFSFCLLMNVTIAPEFRATKESHQQLMTVYWLLAALSFFIVFRIFAYAEISPAKDGAGFPYRHFILPLPTWQLALFPIILGVASMELVFLAWVKLIFTPAEVTKPWWLATVLGASMFLYPAILWTLGPFRVARILALGITGGGLVGITILPYLSDSAPLLSWFSDKLLSLWLAGLSLVACLVACFIVGRQRHGGGGRISGGRWGSWVILTEKVIAIMPTRKRDFTSPAAAQFWFEWRRTGLLLPGVVGAVLLLLLGPLSVENANSRNDNTIFIFICLMLMPVIFGAIIGKGFGKPDFWSSDTALMPFQAVRPLTAGDMVLAKLKVAALSSALTWGLIVIAIPLWLVQGQNAARVEDYWFGFRVLHSALFVVTTLVLAIVAGLVLTWRGMVESLWAGLAGDQAKLNWYAVIYVVGFLTLLTVYLNSSLWQYSDMPVWIGWGLALAVAIKLWAALFTWAKTIEQGHVHSKLVWKYLAIWTVGTLCLVALAFLVCSDNRWMRNLLVLIALLSFPLASLGIAPLSLARNRHR